MKNNTVSYAFKVCQGHWTVLVKKDLHTVYSISNIYLNNVGNVNNDFSLFAYITIIMFWNNDSYSKVS